MKAVGEMWVMVLAGGESADMRTIVWTGGSVYGLAVGMADGRAGGLVGEGG